MKIKITFFFTLFIMMIFSPNLRGQTSLEEYNYITVGYQEKIAEGQDMKKGYEVVAIDTVRTKIATAELYAFNRIKDNKKEIAAYLIIYKRTGRTTEYICAPNPKSDGEILQKFYAALWDGSSETSSKGQLISILLSRRLKF